MPLPPQAVGVGDRWHAPNEIMVRMPEGEVKRIAIRKQYTIKSISTGVAKIEVDTQVLTPVDDPKVKSQLMQQLTRGEIQFDIDGGRVLSSQIDWDERVIGFSGAESAMKYLARLTEQIKKTEPATAKK
jgi:hypothetical protein